MKRQKRELHLKPRPKPFVDPSRPTHKHNGRKYLVELDTHKCWMCGQVVQVEEQERTPDPRQLVLTTQPQLELQMAGL
jgi:hypothetical protein